MRSHGRDVTDDIVCHCVRVLHAAALDAVLKSLGSEVTTKQAPLTSEYGLKFWEAHSKGAPSLREGSILRVFLDGVRHNPDPDAVKQAWVLAAWMRAPRRNFKLVKDLGGNLNLLKKVCPVGLFEDMLRKGAPFLVGVFPPWHFCECMCV